MCKIKGYCKAEFDLKSLGLQHPQPEDFYLSAWQRTRSVVPLLIWRTLLFLLSVGIMLSSMVSYGKKGHFGYWFIYLTHWGLTAIVLTTGFAVSVSARCYFYGPLSAEFLLPWYVKTYWVLQNIAVSVAFLVTVFYWTIIFEPGVDKELNHALTFAIHALNSVVMLLLLVSSSHPARILHIYQPLCFALSYVLFLLFYYWAGGVEPNGKKPWVYPVMNWAKPGPTLIYCAITGLLLVFLYFLTVGIVLARDFVARKLLSSTETNGDEEG